MSILYIVHIDDQHIETSPVRFLFSYPLHTLLQVQLCKARTSALPPHHDFRQHSRFACKAAARPSSFTHVGSPSASAGLYSRPIQVSTRSEKKHHDEVRRPL